MELKIKVAIAALMLCGAMIGCGPSKWEMEYAAKKAKVDETRAKWEADKTQANYDAAYAATEDWFKAADADCPRVGPFPESWNKCIGPVNAFQIELRGEHEADAKVKEEVKAKARAAALALNPEEDALYDSQNKAISKTYDACNEWAEDVGACGHNCTPEIYQAAGGWEEKTRRGEKCLEKKEDEERALNDKYPHAYARVIESRKGSGSGVTLDQLFKQAHTTLHQDDGDPCASTGYLCASASRR
jgi:hypothetical protein